MTNPRTLLLSIAATACCFILALAGVAGPGPVASAPAQSAATVPGLVSVELRREAADRVVGSAPHVVGGPDRLNHTIRGGEPLAVC